MKTYTQDRAARCAELHQYFAWKACTAIAYGWPTISAHYARRAMLAKAVSLVHDTSGPRSKVFFTASVYALLQELAAYKTVRKK